MGALIASQRLSFCGSPIVRYTIRRIGDHQMAKRTIHQSSNIPLFRRIPAHHSMHTRLARQFPYLPALDLPLGLQLGGAVDLRLGRLGLVLPEVRRNQRIDLIIVEPGHRMIEVDGCLQFRQRRRQRLVVPFR